MNLKLSEATGILARVVAHANALDINVSVTGLAA